MADDDFRLKSEGWFSTGGPENDVVVSSRVRLARNIDGIVFPEKMTATDNEQLFTIIFNTIGEMKRFRFYNLDSLKLSERILLAERHYIRPGANFEGGQSILVSDDEKALVIFNDTDHIRIKSIKSGLDLREAYNCCNEIDNFLDERVTYAFSPAYGYLTSELLSAGTGMSASVMLFLPAIRRAGKIDKALTEILKSGLSVRGFSGDGISDDESLGDMYIIDNQFSIGKTEEELIRMIESIVTIIIDYERETRNILIESDRINIEDEIFRAKGILENCRKITLAEAVRHLSSLKLGIYYNLIEKNITYSLINCLLLQIQKSHIIRNNRNSDEDILRAGFIKNRLFGKDQKNV